ncbi:uncharacterized protein CMC5_072830 [Chondromyces crocatus]|uniref:Serine aminopeptidase S33 domain-containing protein n=1 Tax=Chondromyces crocatus TaxID=52 RepID=A0A0K1EQF0_CHOCO|nr:uncharacterized protein CMC5_072830 [Chondromyces crocatus]
MDTVESGTNEGSTLTERGKALVQRLEARQFAAIVQGFDATMGTALPEPKLAEVWDGLVASVGPLQEVVAVRTEASGAYALVLVTCRFEKTTLDAKISFDAQEKVAGLFFGPSKPPAKPWEAPAYVDLAALTEREVKVNPGPWEVPGILTLPRGKGPFPAVVLVHGSGPNDRDETVGANRPFKDLALGLATKGIASLRYDKRTLVYGAKLRVDELGMDQESVDDAVAAVAQLAKEGSIDPAQIYVVGHSLGGMLAPRIATQTKGLAGIVLLAASTRQVPEMMVEQLEYIASLSERGREALKGQIEQVKEAGQRIRALQGGAAPKPDEVILGAGARYWVEFGKYDPLATAKGLGLRIYVAHGERDYQVTDVDYRAWEKALTGKKNVTLKLYPALNHLMIAGTGPSSPAEYEPGGHVDAALVADLASWIGAAGPRPSSL